jgi:hypothetical protein
LGVKVERLELVQAEHDLRFAGLRQKLAIGDGVEVLDAGLLCRVVGILRSLPSLQALKGDAFACRSRPGAW